MKKIICTLLLSVAFFPAAAQDTVYPGDPNSGYIIPILWQFNYSYNHTITISSHQRMGLEYPRQNDGTKIYGIACAIDSFYIDSVYGYLFKKSSDIPIYPDAYSINTRTFIDSTLIERQPAGYLSVPILPFKNITVNEHPIYLDTTPPLYNKLFPLYEGYFDSGYPIDDLDFDVVIGYPYLPLGYSLGKILILRGYSIDDYLQMASFQDTIVVLQTHPDMLCVFPITDREKWLNYISGRCPRPGTPSVTYSYDGSEAEIRWGAPAGLSLYEVAYGSYAADPDSFATDTTSNAAYTIHGLAAGDTLLFRVRGMCVYEDTVQVWSPWSETVQIDKGPFAVTVESNNPDWGSVSGAGSYERGAEVPVEASPAPSCSFDRWDDGSTENPRLLHVTSDMSLTAVFSCLGGIDTPSPLQLQLSPNPSHGTLSLSTNGSGPSRYEVLDGSGKRVAQGSFSGSAALINLEQLPTGHYTLRLSSPESAASASFVIVKP